MTSIAAPAAAPSAKPRPAWRGVYEASAIRYRRTWRSSLYTSFGQPLMYLLALGWGLGTLVDKGSSAGASTALQHGVSYLTFLAPGLLAATLMQTAAMECTFPVFASIKWLRIYDAMLNTPIDVRAIVGGQLTWVATRLTMNAIVFVALIAVFGAAHSPWIVLAVPAAVLTAMAFAAPITAFSATQEKEANLSGLFRFGVLPLFLFSGTFFPISQLPGWLRPVAWISPLWHGVDLCRDLAIGRMPVARSCGHVAFLLACFAVGSWWAVVTHRKRLAP